MSENFTLKLRDYQIKTIEMIKEKLLQGHKKILVVLATGSGKSVIMNEILKMCIGKGNKILSLVHRRQLVDQLADRYNSSGVESGTIMAGIEPNLSLNSQVASLQTYNRRIQFEEVDLLGGEKYRPWLHDADILIIDESHHSLSRTYQDILEHYKDKVVLGFTATPSLSSGAGFYNYYETLIQPVQVADLVKDGSLVPGAYYGLPAPDLSGIRTVQGDFEKKVLGERANTPKLIGDIVENWNRIAHSKKTIVFAVNVKHSKAIVHEFNKFGISAKHLDAKCDDDKRNETLNMFKSGEINVLSNVNLYTEGTDVPEIECVCLARPTKSIGFYLQMVGRGARPFPGKSNFVVLDHGENVQRHGFYEDPIEWTLEGKKISYHKLLPREPKEKHQMHCSICSAIFTGKICPECRTEVPDYGKKIEAIEADLKLLNKTKKNKTEDKKNTFKNLKPSILISMLIFEKNRLGKSDSWVRANYRNLTNKWPKSLDVRPMPATEELKSYLKYLRIKWIKGQQRKNAA